MEIYPTADVLWRQTERDRVYNYLIYVPYQSERVMWFGCLICLISTISHLTLLPVRVVRAVQTWRRSHKSISERGIRGNQLFDIVCLAILLAAAVCMCRLRPGFIYYWMKDITSEFLKIQVVYSALEIADKVSRAATGQG